MHAQAGRLSGFFPMEKADFAADVIPFTGTPFQVSHIIFLDAFETGEVDTVHGEPFCSGVIAGPITIRKSGLASLI